METTTNLKDGAGEGRRLQCSVSKGYFPRTSELSNHAGEGKRLECLKQGIFSKVVLEKSVPFGGAVVGSRSELENHLFTKGTHHKQACARVAGHMAHLAHGQKLDLRGENTVNVLVLYECKRLSVRTAAISISSRVS